MDDFDIFSDETNFTRPHYKDVLHKYITEIPATPSGPNYQSCNKLMAQEYLVQNDDACSAFHLSEAVSESLRILALYRDVQLKDCENKLHKITRFIKPMQDIMDPSPISKYKTVDMKEVTKTLSAFKIQEEDPFYKSVFDMLSVDIKEVTKTQSAFKIQEEEPFHKKYLRFGSENNVDNFQKVLKELPKEWTVIQLTAPYNPNENLKLLNEYKTEIDSVYLSMFTNDYAQQYEFGPITVNIPANVPGEGVKPLFTELYALLEENYKTIDNARFLNNKRLVQNYWSRREDVDLRMKSVIYVMDREWLGGWGCLLTGKLVDTSLRNKIIKLVDDTINNWGFIRLTPKQRILLYNLLDACPSLSSQQIKPCIRRILTEHGDPEDLRQHLPVDCQSCYKDFKIKPFIGRILTELGDPEDIRQYLLDDCRSCTKSFKMASELCLKCLMKSFEGVHKFSLVDGIRAFSQAVMKVKDGEEWTMLKKAKRHPVILIVDELLDTFPWESLPILSQHPVSRIESIHFLYSLYKTHQDKIVDGYYAAKSDIGRYVINPENNLERMEKRMNSFIQYWCGYWSGHVSQPPPPNEFIEHLTTSDVFLYCGHGDGCDLGNGGGGCGVEGARGTRCAAVLSGCGSVRLQRGPGREPPMAAHYHLRVAGSPMVIGMLWEVTDLEVDKMVSTLVSLYVPSDAPVPWPSVGKTNWNKGELDTNVEVKLPFTPEPDVLRAVSRARASTSFVLIAASMVARGLPMRIHSHALLD